ncbi:MAG: hypothetical protein JW774_04305 [Candidatus Aureabacteria bacterium]|nr:hypothetical protein [Candidatus Auribacterota bacterium]
MLNRNKVRYLLLGGWAVGIYGYPRATADMDILISIDDKNLDRLLKALHEFGAPAIDKKHFKEKGNVFRMGAPPVKIELINQASGIDMDDCYSRRKIFRIKGLNISLISKEDLIRNKKSSSRAKDKADAENLEEMPEEN